MKGFFVTGTDTGVGKTLIASALALGALERGFRVGVMKPIETGCEPDPLDAKTLLSTITDKNSMKSEDPRYKIECVCPYIFRMPASPEEAARAEGKEISPQLIYSIYADLASSSDCMVVEGAGGLLVPVCEGVEMATLARQMGLPLVIVARAGLGTVNHSLLTVRMSRILGLTVRAVVLVKSKEGSDPSESSNPDAIRRRGGVEVLGPLPFLSRYPPSREVLAELYAGYLSSLWA